MNHAFESKDDIVNIGHAGTTMRFLTAYFAAAGIEKTITGSDRMKNRPIGELVNALNSLGAGISYAEKEGFPPLKTSGKLLDGDTISLKGSISSQYITALLLIAPALPNGLTIHINDHLISSSYVRLTLQMRNFLESKVPGKGTELKLLIRIIFQRIILWKLTGVELLTGTSLQCWPIRQRLPCMVCFPTVHRAMPLLPACSIASVSQRVTKIIKFSFQENM
ncbi:MAG: hypothetical protein HC905_29910 [Bacteroidales bacterium]|nr:hypothetical protein [Bacteroidales bacterium]